MTAPDLGNGDDTDPVTDAGSPTEAAPARVPDPMKGFRGVAAGTLILEVIVVGLSLLVVQRTAGGLASGAGLFAGGIIVALIAACGVLRRGWGIWFVAAIQVVLIAGFFVLIELGVVGVIFGLVWTYLFYLRRDVAKRMAEGRLPSQQR
ncbi:DUF4233 domain-containing protein [Actinocrispum wychmicini]|uniref:Uncharacterized protein DUF4233 n=1 Tax=Actinocrispum wychmicini TaxID=1213861 RepID=A0A4R2J1P9_9PSEU|nr:DUF4233 domain-containing protein [Actinocrispum wychmicini]TCO50766.1 uncharacterized protein DUF4233 [Actinocrispum wychmicini]